MKIGIIFLTGITLSTGSLRALCSVNYCEGKGSSRLDKRKQVTVLKAWMASPSRFRIEETANGRKLITICDGAHMWLLKPENKTGLHRTRSAPEVAAMKGKRRVIGDDLAGFRKNGAVLRGNERVGQTMCERYEMSRDGLTHSIWVTPDSERLTIRRLSAGRSTFSTGPKQPREPHNIRREMTYSWKSSVPMPASLFEVPAGYKIKETQAAPPPVVTPQAGKRS